ncbi:hypothetical protein I4U23_024086 [Adineta vaga]|nr:hypothetical protein I4U23_024086 [Adineta vaga]
MGSLFSSSHNQQNSPGNNPLIHQAYNVEFGYAPVGPVGPVASVPKRNMYGHQSSHHRRHRRRY